MKKLLFLACFATLMACNNDDDNTPVIENPEPAGLAYAVSDSDFSTTYNGLRAALQSNSNIKIVAEINHRANAQSVGKELRNTRLLIFGNPALGTPVMQANQQAGLDLPQKILVYEDEDNNVFATYNSTDYLAKRHNVANASTLQQISSALSGFVTEATGDNISENSSASITAGQGVFTSISQNDFSTTYNKLRNAISDNADLAIIAEVDHSANAQSVGMQLNDTRLIIFGNPEAGTPLMKDSQTTAIDLPQKMLVWENDGGEVRISYNNPEYLRVRHGLDESDDVVQQIKTLLANLAIDAAN
ncbi:MAG: hypothetical protein CMC08_05220 [Flavobacteriaceae bacterium]|nr:hypothetical protein [Flavobacteriaceae bacterium]